IPGDHGLPKMTGEENWYDEWKAIDPDKRGSMRTYSIREFRRAGEHDEGANGEAELDIDFALHGVGTPDSGTAATWAVEVQPGEATNVVILGDETALPAMLRIADEWPAELTGTMYCELVDSADIPQIDFPANLTVNWVPRTPEHAYGDLLVESAARLFEVEN